jgi:hypothetical protein
MLAPFPAGPAASPWPRRFDAWLGDHFAWRGELLSAGLALQSRAGLRARSSQQVVRGSGDWLLLDQGLLAATGQQTDPAAARRYAAYVCALAQDAKGRGAAFLFAPAPSTAEVYPQALPDWLAPRSPSQMDLTLAAVRACGAPTLDLRPAMAAAKAWGALYQHHDSHWTNIGALAAYDAAVQALGQPWTIAPADMHWRPRPAILSDLVRLSGAVDVQPELTPEPPEGPDARPDAGGLGDLEHGAFPPPFQIPGARPGPPLLIVGDSYTGDFIGQYFRRNGPSLAWINQAECRFDRRILDRVRPAYVLLMPASRLIACR